MRRRMFPLALGLLVLFAGQGTTQAPKAETVTIETVDGVELKGTYWGGTKGKKSPVALLLHKINGKSSEDGWKNLAEELQKAGFAVLSFDFRGHGGSVTVQPKFWELQHNRQHVRRRAGATPPPSVALGDFGTRYWPYLINDIAAAMRFLERRYNDPGECNLSNTVLIGAEDGATLGALWLASEARRYRIQQTGGRNERPESKDVIAAVWLSISTNLGPQNRAFSVASFLPGWIKDAGNSLNSKVPMAFIYGGEDKTGDFNALRFARSLKGPTYKRGAKPLDTDPLRATGDHGIPNSKLLGSKLLTEELETRKWILDKYLQGFVLDDKKGLNEWEKRESDKWVHVWDFSNNPRMWISCNPGPPLQQPFGIGKLLNVVPLARLNLQP